MNEPQIIKDGSSGFVIATEEKEQQKSCAPLEKIRHVYHN